MSVAAADGRATVPVPRRLRRIHSGLRSHVGCITGPAIKGEPVQILRVEDDQRIVFNERALEGILLSDHIKDRPVVVVAIAGACRQGKSFLLNFLLTYLRHNGRSTWIEETDIPLSGFHWRPGSTRETAGILLWNEVFLMTNSKGEEVAVLLMDTQGTFDCESTMKESTMIFSLSMMTSSVQIYNIMNNIKEDDLQHLQFFAEYGRLAQKDNKTRAFQKLLFLVRDWMWAHEFEFGSCGGRSLITSRLNTTDGQAPELKTLRQNISSCFSELDCFLMPYPGKKVASDKSFDGRLADIEEAFREKLQELVLSILAPENLLVKEINGQKLSCQDLMTFFKAHVDVFKGGDLPNPTSVLTATANATNMAAVDKATKRYMSGMVNWPRRNVEILRLLHFDMLDRATRVFDEFPKVGSEATSSSYKDALIKELEQLFFHFYEEAKELIRIEKEAEEKREKERQEWKKRQEERERERIAEKEKAAAREKEIERDRKAFTDREATLQRRAVARKERLKKLKEEADRERKQTLKIEAKMQSEVEEKLLKIGHLKMDIGNLNAEKREAAIEMAFECVHLAAAIMMFIPGGALPGSMLLASNLALQLCLSLSLRAIRERRNERNEWMRILEQRRRYSSLLFPYGCVTEGAMAELYASRLERMFPRYQ
uniref:Putative atlastin-2 n=1 Tax=Rhipicephalus pulchellus TaxID=72859 RepID=L7LY69_RHIPC